MLFRSGHSLLGKTALIPAITITTGLALLLNACGGGGGGFSSSDNPSSEATLQRVLSQPLGKAQAQCTALKFTPAEAVPGEEVTLIGVPSDFDEPGFRVIAKDDDGKQVIVPLFAVAPADTDPAGELHFITPLHPVNPAGGGDVKIELGDGEQYCSALKFTIKALPTPAQGDDKSDPKKVLKKLKKWVNANITQLGYDPVALLNMPADEVPPQQMGLWLAKHLVSSDDPNALPALAEDAANDSDSLLPALLLASGFADDLDPTTSSLPNATIIPADDPKNPVAPRAFSNPNNNPMLAARALTITPRANKIPKCNGDLLAFNPDKFNIHSAEELSQHMLLAKEGYLFKDATASQLLGLTSIGAGQFKGKAAGRVNKAGSYGGLAVYAVSTVDQARLALEPKVITSFNVTRGSNRWVEDRLESDPETAWLSAKVKAEGSTFNVSKVVLESLINALGMVPGPVGTAVSITTTGDSIAGTNYVNDTVDDLTKGACVRINAPTYGPIPVGQSDKKWTKVEVTSDAIELVPGTGNSHKFYGTRIGQSKIRVGLNPDKFPLPFPDEKILPIFVNPISLAATPAFTSVNAANQEVDVTASAGNAHSNDAGQHISATPSGGSILNSTPSGKNRNITYKTPADLAELPTSVEFEWTGKTLPGGNPDARKTKAVFDKNGKITLSPQSACVSPGDQITIKADIEGFPSANSIAWTSGGGTLQADGNNGLTQLYTASNTTGTFKVEAFDTDPNTDVHDETVITISENCLKKAWLPVAGAALQGKITYDPMPSNGSCPTKNKDDIQGKDTQLTVDPDAVTRLTSEAPKDSDLWYSRRETAGGKYSHQATYYKQDDRFNDGSHCISVNLAGKNDSKITFASDQDEPDSLSYHADIDITADCKEYADGVGECVSSAGAVIGGQGFYFFDITGKTEVHLEGFLDCRLTSGALNPSVPIMPVSVTTFRNGGPTIVQNGKIVGMYNDLATCNSPNELTYFDETFILDAPSNGPTDSIMLNIILPNYTIGAGPTPATLSTIPAFPAGGGTLTAEGNMDFSIKVSTKQL